MGIAEIDGDLSLDVNFSGGFTEEEFSSYLDELHKKTGFELRATMSYIIIRGDSSPKLAGMERVADGLRRQTGQRVRTLEVISSDSRRTSFDAVANIFGEPYEMSDGTNSRCRYYGLNVIMNGQNRSLQTNAEVVEEISSFTKSYRPRGFSGKSS
ncbi:MAG: hypothetical protein AABW73_00260 [Nanoarchaeota archaeon]